MRTTLNLDEDVAAAVDKMRRERSIGISEAVNVLVRRGLAAPERPRRLVQRTAPVGVKIDVANVGEVLDHLDQLEHDDRR